MSDENVSEADAREAIAACLMRFAGYKKSRARAVARALMHRLPEPVAYHDKDQPRGIAWCPGYPAALPDISPLYTIGALGSDDSDVVGVRAKDPRPMIEIARELLADPDFAQIMRNLKDHPIDGVKAAPAPKGLRYHYGADEKPRCDDCSAEVYGFDEGLICSGCGAVEAEEPAAGVSRSDDKTKDGST